MIVSTKGRYALRVMIDLAQTDRDAYVPLKEITQRLSISMKYLEAIVAILVKGELVCGMRGKGGGYKLTRPLKDYTVAEILEQTEITLAPVACVKKDSEPCQLVDSCPTRSMWEGLDEVIQTYLQGITLEDLVCGNVSV